MQSSNLTQKQLQELRDKIVELTGTVVRNKIVDAEYRNNLANYEKKGKVSSEELNEEIVKRSPELVLISTYQESDRIDIALTRKPVDNPITKSGQIIHSDATYTNVVFPYSVDPLMDPALYDFLNYWHNLSKTEQPTRGELLKGINDLSSLAKHNIKIQDPNLFNGFHGIILEDNLELTKRIDALINDDVDIDK